MTPSCRAFRRRLPLLVGGELPAGRAARLRGHLLGCEECSQLRRQLEAGRHLVAEAVRNEAEADSEFLSVRTAVLARLAAESERRGAQARFSLWPALAPLGAAVAAAAILFLGGGDKPTGPAALPNISQEPAIHVSSPGDGLTRFRIVSEGARVHRVAVSSRSWDFHDARTFEVRNGEWVDRSPDPQAGQAVFYRVD
jgi:putative zinc finger protein